MMQIKKSRIPFLVMGMLCLLAGLAAGLARIGWSELSFPAMTHHGGIMIGGFLGTLISLEKIIPLKKKWLYVIPGLSALSVILFLTGFPVWAFIILVSASTGLTFVFGMYFARERSLVYGIMLGGSLCWAAGNYVLVFDTFYPLAVSWWMAFAFFIISAERIELMKFLPVSNRQKYFFTALLFLFFAGAILSFHNYGRIVQGISLISCSLWLLTHDVIGITIRKSGLPKYVAIALLTGYIALLLTGVFMISFSSQAFAYDIIVHTFFIGFVFAMIFAHGPIILPGVIGSSAKPFHPVSYFWLTLLHLSWLLRFVGGFLLEPWWRMLSGLITAVAILAYFVSLVAITVVIVKQQHRVNSKRSTFVPDENHQFL